MKRFKRAVFLGFVIGAVFTMLGAPSLQEFLLNANGTTYHNTTAVPGLNAGGFNTTTGLGTLAWTFDPGHAGTYSLGAYFDHQGHVPFFDEYGAVAGTPPAGMSWQIDEPGFGDENRLGTIYGNVIAASLDNTNHVPGQTSNFDTFCGANTSGHAVDAACNNDVAMALGWNFLLGDGQEALFTIVASLTPRAGFHLGQFDPETGDAIYLSATGEIRESNGPPPPGIPEPSTVVLFGTGLLGAIAGKRGRSLVNKAMGTRHTGTALAVLAVLISAPCFAVTPVVKVVPFVPNVPTIPHDTYGGRSITLKGTSDVQGPNIQATWNFGDGSAPAVFTVTNMYNVSATHIYAGPTNTIWTATLTIKDTNAGGGSSSKQYKVIMRDNNLSSNVNVAIDEGLWYLHTTMNRTNVGMTTFGDWTGGASCSGAFDCSAYYGVTATNLQAFEVNGHYENGDPDNPYTDDVARGLRSVISWLNTSAITSRNVPTAAPPSCTSPPCALNPDGNGNGYGAFVNQGYPFYQGGMFIDAIVATGTPNAVSTTGTAAGGGNPGILGRKYKDIVQDLVDGYIFCQYVGANTGGGWRYSCGDFPDNSACQWGAIGIVGAVRGFGVVVPPLVYDWNKVWLNNTQDTSTGVFGYTGPTPVWGPYAVTPSGMVQLAMDGIGRGNSMWDKAETYIRDNFGNDPSSGPGASIKDYYYGLFSFTKSMLLHDPGSALQPITFLQSKTPGVAPIDWYAAEVVRGDPTDGVARTLVRAQNAAGYWWNEEYYGDQYPFSTGFAIIMLRKTVFVSCVSNLAGRGTSSGTSPARVDLTWSSVQGADHYVIFRGTVTGGPYTMLKNNVTGTSYSDTSGLQNGHTYYYVLQPANSQGGEICQSNEAKVTIPNTR